jgi:Predicted nucleotide-binding protein containing TIR-like domain
MPLLPTRKPWVILFTPDEVVALRPEYADGDEDPEVRPACQARPNVIFEAGLAIGRDPDRVVLVELGRLRQFSDVMGRQAVRLGNSLASRQELAVRLRIAGCPVDLSGTDWHTSGDFSPPPAAEGVRQPGLTDEPDCRSRASRSRSA